MRLMYLLSYRYESSSSKATKFTYWNIRTQVADANLCYMIPLRSVFNGKCSDIVMSVVLPDEICEMLGLECNVGATRTRKVVIDNITKRVNLDDKFVISKLREYTGAESTSAMLDRLKEMVKVLPLKQKCPKEDTLSTEIKVTLSEDLRKFLKSDSQKMSVTDVLKAVIGYIDQHGLQCRKVRRNIVMNDELKKLLNVPDDEQLTFFNLDRFLRVHYID